MSALPLVRLLLFQELFCGLEILLLGYPDVSLGCYDLWVAHKLLSRKDIFASLIVLGCLRCSKVVALDGESMPLEELANQIRPFVSWVLPLTRREHDIRVRISETILVGFHDGDCLRINRDSASSSLLGSKVQLNVAFFISGLLCDGAKGQTYCVLNT